MPDNYITFSELLLMALILGSPIIVLMGIVYYFISKSYFISFILQACTLILSIIVWMFVPMQYFMFSFISLPTLIAALIVLALLIIFRNSVKDFSWNKIAKRLFIFAICGLMTAGCMEKDSKKIIMYISCGEFEIAGDLEHSVNANKLYFEENNIDISYSEDSGKCGYELRNGAKTMNIERVLTDIELHDECRKFFGN